MHHTPQITLYIVEQDFYQFWPDEETEYGKVKVSLKSKNERKSYNGYKFSIIGEAVVSGTLYLKVKSVSYSNNLVEGSPSTSDITTLHWLAIREGPSQH